VPQGSFWGMHEVLFQRQGSLEDHTCERGPLNAGRTSDPSIATEPAPRSCAEISRDVQGIGVGRGTGHGDVVHRGPAPRAIPSRGAPGSLGRLATERVGRRVGTRHRSEPDSRDQRTSQLAIHWLMRTRFCRARVPTWRLGGTPGPAPAMLVLRRRSGRSAARTRTDITAQGSPGQIPSVWLVRK
jgi:hypothetical protein